MLNIHNIVFKIVIFSIIVLLMMAYFVEYHYQVPPCKFCMYQRTLYFITLIICVLGVMLPKLEDFFAVIANIFLLVIMSVAFTQVLVEYGFIAHLFNCETIVTSEAMSVAEYKSKILGAELISCDRPFTIMATSLAGYSFIFSTAAFIFMLMLNITHLGFRHDPEIHAE